VKKKENVEPQASGTIEEGYLKAKRVGDWKEKTARLLVALILGRRQGLNCGNLRGEKEMHYDLPRVQSKRSADAKQDGGGERGTHLNRLRNEEQIEATQVNGCTYHPRKNSAPLC